MQTKKRIHKHLTIEEILSLFPGKAQFLAQEITNAGLHCIGCGAASYETLEAGMLGHGMQESSIDTLVDRLNALLESDETQKEDVAITERAAKKYLEILRQEGKEGYGIRFAEKVSGCNGFEYILDYSKEPRENDTIFVSHGLEIHVDNNYLDRLKGSEIDFIDGLNGSGFKISNPNVKSSCHCGSSHGY